jgi:BASS family bile acid:Na+ symporter
LGVALVFFIYLTFQKYWPILSPETRLLALQAPAYRLPGWWALLAAIAAATFSNLFSLIGVRREFIGSLTFTLSVFGFVAASMFYPQAFMTWGGYDLGKLIVPLIQIIMFGMGTTLSVADFTRVLKMPWPVFIGFFLQFTIMPLVGFMLAKAFGFSNEIAAGVVLIGCCPSGVASNVMAYLGGGNVALSVTVTSCSTLAAPLMTPLLMRYLAGQFVKVEFVSMMLDIVNMIIVPIIAGLIANRILYSRRPFFQHSAALVLVGVVGVLLGAGIGLLMPASDFAIGNASVKVGLVVGLLLIGAVALTKLVIGVWLKGPANWMDKVLPIVSMVAICCIIAVITARSAKDLKAVGALLIVAVMIHNAVGYCVGYWLARAAHLEESACRTVAFEVGMQNGGMASALAMSTFNSVQAALAPAIFGPWQNISGSVLATWWHRKPAVCSVPVRASEARVEGVPPSDRGQDARDTTPHGVTTSE